MAIGDGVCGFPNHMVPLRDVSIVIRHCILSRVTKRNSDFGRK